MVNTYGHFPSNVSGILDYKTKLAPALFVLLDEYIEKVGVIQKQSFGNFQNGLVDLKPVYPNIEKIGLTLIETRNNDIFEATSTAFFFELIEQTTEKVQSAQKKKHRTYSALHR